MSKTTAFSTRPSASRNLKKKKKSKNPALGKEERERERLFSALDRDLTTE